MDTPGPQPGVTHGSFIYRPLARTSHITSTFCKGGWEIKGIQKYLEYFNVSAA